MANFHDLIQKNVLLKDSSRWKIGGPADLFAEPADITEMRILLQEANKLGLPVQVIGNGTNILFDDRGYRGLIIKMGSHFSHINVLEKSVLAEAGAWTPCFARSMGNLGYTGIEHTIGIPGTLGGLVVMNGGSLRKSISTNILRVFAIDYHGELYQFDNQDCKFDYRHSIFQEQRLIIYKIEFHFNTLQPERIREEMLTILKTRKQKFPLKMPNCGSTFISDPKLYESHGSPGKIIEDLGLKGYTIGGAMISNQHANFIINIGHATSNDVLEIIKYICEEINKRLSKRIKTEIKYLLPNGGLTSIDKL